MKLFKLKWFGYPLLTFIVLMPGCSPFKKIFKTKEYTELNARRELNSDLNYLKVDKSVIAVRKTIDTTLVIPAKVVKQNIKTNIDSLIKGIVAMQNNLVEVKLTLHPQTGMMETVATLKPQNVSVKLDQTTTQQNNVVEQQNRKTSEINSSKQSAGSTVLKKEPTRINILLVVLFVGLFVLFIYLRMLKIR